MSVLSSDRAEKTTPTRRMPVGAELLPEGGVHFRAWAPKCEGIAVDFDGAGGIPSVVLEAEADGYFSGFSPEARAGTLYRLRPNGDDKGYPDPASRCQPSGVHGPSQVVDPNAYKWSDVTWKGVPAHGQVLYELHIGTLTPEGTWASAITQLAALKEVGITCLEVMPVCEFAGAFGWGYDGVNLFAPYSKYGSPDDFRAFVDAAHALGIGVILDLVYNHLGPDGNYMLRFSGDYLNAHHHTDWGDAINFDGANNAPVRELFLANAKYWIDEFHLDGFRFDATQAIVDESPRHILAEITDQTRALAGEKTLYIINENEPQDTKLVRPTDSGGYGMDALWNDDFHHAALVALSGRSEAYYMDHPGRAQEFISAAKWGYLFQGQRYGWQKRRRGTPALDLPPAAFVHFLQNHDQVANSGRGLRAHQISSPGQLKAMTALWLLMPQTPMFFQGQEWAASAPFFYFADHNPDLAKLVCAGRVKELSSFPSIADEAMTACLREPHNQVTFSKSKLDPREREMPFHAEMLRLHSDLLKLRREEPVFSRMHTRGDIDGAVLGDGAFLLRYFGEDHDLLLVVNFERDLSLKPCPEPLLAPPLGQRWKRIFSSEDPAYGGSGTPAVDTEKEGWFLPGRCAVLLRPAPLEQGAIPSRRKIHGSAQESKRKPKPQEPAQ